MPNSRKQLSKQSAGASGSSIALPHIQSAGASRQNIASPIPGDFLRRQRVDTEPSRKRLLVILLMLIVCSPAAPGFWSSAAVAPPTIPSQFIAKMYSEALGRTPDAGGYQSAVSFFTQNGCNKTSLKSWGRGIYLSAEYNNLAYDNAAKVLTLYRGILNREPEQSGFNSKVNQLNSGVPLANVVDALFNSLEFQILAPRICGGGSTPDRFAYGFGAQYPLTTIPTSGTGFKGGKGDQLQTIINSTPAGGTVWLAQKAVVRLLKPLTIKAGVTLSTTGGPGHNRYALMGRLVRDTHFSFSNPKPGLPPVGAPAVRLQSGAKLRAVWVDGGRGRLGYDQEKRDDINVALMGGTGTQVSDCLISDTSGWTGLQVYGSAEGMPCSNVSIVHNLVTAYSSAHHPPSPLNEPWADGLSCACESTLIQENEVVDATDVGIIIYRSTPATQKSIVRNNRVFSAGNSAYAAYCADPLKVTQDEPSLERNFTGSMIQNNTLWTGPNSHFDIALAVGTRAWFGDPGVNPDPSATGIGATFTGNVTGPLSARAGSGIGVCGMRQATVQSNVLSISLIEYPCPKPYVWACVMSGFASGNIQPYTDVNLTKHCIGHKKALPSAERRKRDKHVRASL